MIRTGLAAVAVGLWAGITLAQVAPPPRPDGLGIAPVEGIEAAAALLPPIPEAAAEPPGLAEGMQGPPVPPVETRRKVRPRDPNRGQVTNMPLPRYVSLKTSECNARRGPGLTHRIDWVFKRAGMPLKITAEYEHWRRVEDADGVGGWVNFALLSGVRTVVVAEDMAEFRSRPDDQSQVVYQAELGVVGKIVECQPDWCRISVEGEKGWARKTALWGVDPGEIVD